MSAGVMALTPVIAAPRPAGLASATAGPATPGVVPARHPFDYLPVGLFGFVKGLTGLSVA